VPDGLFKTVILTEAQRSGRILDVVSCSV